MKVAFLINDYTTLVESMATAMFMESSARRDHEVLVFGVADWVVDERGKLFALARKYPSPLLSSRGEQLKALKESKPYVLSLEEMDVLWIRTNPARDQRRWAHDSSLLLAEILESRGVLVLNRPAGLRKASSKLYLMTLPEEVRPTTFVAHHPEQIKGFVESQGEDCVVKPVQGTRGQNVFVLRSPKADNQNQILDVLEKDGFIMAQTFVPEAPQGDVRLIVMNGKLLEKDGEVAAIHRVPGKGDFRSNIHTGGRPQPPIITQTMRDVVNSVSERLVQDGLFLVGVDFIGGRIIELNVFSTGGFRDAERFTGIAFTNLVVAEIERQVEARV